MSDLKFVEYIFQSRYLLTSHKHDLSVVWKSYLFLENRRVSKCGNTHSDLMFLK